MTPLGIGLVGLGRWGANYVRTIGALPECRLVAAADPDASARGRVHGVRVVADMSGLLEIPEVEAVIVASPDELHYGQAREAIDADRDVLVEKPPAMSEYEAEDLARAAEDAGRVVAVGHTMLHHPRFAALRHTVATGRLGRVERLVMARTSEGRTGCSSVIRDLTPHDLAMAVALLGEPVAVRARQRTECAVSYLLQFAADVVACGWAAWTGERRVRRFRACGELGTAAFRDEERMAAAAAETPLGRQCLDFVRACRGRGRPLSDARLGIQVIRSVMALEESARLSGTWVEVARRSAGVEAA